MKNLDNNELKSISGGTKIPITLDGLINAFKTLRETVRDWGHTDGCLQLKRQNKCD